MLNFIGNEIAPHDGKAEFNTIENTMAFLYSDWLYFPWHGIKKNITGIFHKNIEAEICKIFILILSLRF